MAFPMLNGTHKSAYLLIPCIWKSRRDTPNLEGQFLLYEPSGMMGIVSRTSS